MSQKTELERVSDVLKFALSGVVIENCTPQQLADGFLLLALESAEAAAPPMEIARVLISHAERYVAQDAPPRPVAEELKVHFSATIDRLTARGHAPDLVRSSMLVFATDWTAKAISDLTAAGALYGLADCLATRA